MFTYFPRVQKCSNKYVFFHLYTLKLYISFSRYLVYNTSSNRYRCIKIILMKIILFNNDFFSNKNYLFFRNWCAYVHTRLSPTVILENQASYVPNGRGPCGWTGGSCPQRYIMFLENSHCLPCNHVWPETHKVYHLSYICIVG